MFITCDWSSTAYQNAVREQRIQHELRAAAQEKQAILEQTHKAKTRERIIERKARKRERQQEGIRNAWQNFFLIKPEAVAAADDDDDDEQPQSKHVRKFKQRAAVPEKKTASLDIESAKRVCFV